jgi:hypothetical protein
MESSNWTVSLPCIFCMEPSRSDKHMDSLYEMYITSLTYNEHRHAFRCSPSPLLYILLEIILGSETQNLHHINSDEDGGIWKRLLAFCQTSLKSNYSVVTNIVTMQNPLTPSKSLLRNEKQQQFWNLSYLFRKDNFVMHNSFDSKSASFQIWCWYLLSSRSRRLCKFSFKSLSLTLSHAKKN